MTDEQMLYIAIEVLIQKCHHLRTVALTGGGLFVAGVIGTGIGQFAMDGRLIGRVQHSTENKQEECQQLRPPWSARI